MTFALPGLLLGMTAALLPLVIHLLLRPRPREVRFPAVMLLAPVLRSGKRAQRFRHFWLLLVRMLLLAGLALLLAQPTCRAVSADEAVGVPVATVVVLDDSWSLAYETPTGDSVATRAREAALAQVAELADLPPGSRTGLTFADPRRTPEPLAADAAPLRARLGEAAGAAAHAVPLGGALAQAAEMLRTAQQPLRRVVVVTDNAASAWRNVTPAIFADIDQLAVEIRLPAAPLASNLALTDLRPPRPTHPENTPLSLTAALRAAGLAAEAQLELYDAAGAELLRRARVGVLEPGREQSQEVVLPALVRGPHGFLARVTPVDRLLPDQTRYVALTAVEKPRVWLIAPPRVGREIDLTALIVRNLLAPQGLPDEAQYVDLQVLTPGELGAVGGGGEIPSEAPGRGGAASAAADGGQAESSSEGAAQDRATGGNRSPDTVILLSGLQLSPAGRERLRDLVEGGSRLLLIPRAAEPVEFPGVANWLLRNELTPLPAPPGTTLDWPAPAGASEASRANVAATAVRLRLTETYDDVNIVFRYSDGAPAVITRQIGRGRVSLLTTAPDPAWSDIGRRAAGLLTWLHETARAAATGRARSANWIVGAAAQTRFPDLPAAGDAYVRRLNETNDLPRRMSLEDGAPTNGWPTDMPGLFGIATRPDAEPTAIFAVNWPVEESDLTPLTLADARAQLGLDAVRVVAPDPVAERSAADPWRAWANPRSILVGVLLGLLVSELLLSRQAGARERAEAGA